jgi:addiction module RelE/StbE family toxin
MQEHEYKLKFTREAREDLDKIFEYITQKLDAPIAAENLIDKIQTASERLRRFPQIGKIPADDTLAKKGYRMLIVDNFLEFYQVDEVQNIVRIMRIVYGKRNYTQLL